MSPGFPSPGQRARQPRRLLFARYALQIAAEPELCSLFFEGPSKAVHRLVVGLMREVLSFARRARRGRGAVRGLRELILIYPPAIHVGARGDCEDKPDLARFRRHDKGRNQSSMLCRNIIGGLCLVLRRSGTSCPSIRSLPFSFALGCTRILNRKYSMKHGNRLLLHNPRDYWILSLVK